MDMFIVAKERTGPGNHYLFHFLVPCGDGSLFKQQKMADRRTMLRLALTLWIITTSRAQRKTFDRLLNIEEYMKKTCGMNRDTGLPQVFLLLKFGCADRINMTYRCRVTCVSICITLGSTTIDIAVIFPSSRWDITHLVA